MKKSFGLRLSFALAVLGLLLGGSLGWTAGQEDDQDAKKQFETLKKKLPKLIAQEYEKEDILGLSGEPVLEMARRIGRREAKITLVYRDNRKNELGSCFIFLRFFEGSWTTTSFDSKMRGSGSFVDPRKDMIGWVTHQVMRAIDKQKSK
jgi:hypothetical protein